MALLPSHRRLRFWPVRPLGTSRLAGGMEGRRRSSVFRVSVPVAGSSCRCGVHGVIDQQGSLLSASGSARLESAGAGMEGNLRQLLALLCLALRGLLQARCAKKSLFFCAHLFLSINTSLLRKKAVGHACIYPRIVTG